MTKWTTATLLLVLAIPVLAAGDDLTRAVEELFSEDPAEREAARLVVREAGAGAVPLLLERIEAEAGGRDRARDVIEIFDIRDLAAKGGAREGILARLREAIGDRADLHEKGETTLVVQGPLRETLRIRGILRAIREGTDRLVTLEARVLRTRTGSPAGAGATPEETSEVETVVAPRLTCYAGQRARIQIMRRIPVISDFDVRLEDGGTLVDPIVTSVPDGISISVRPRVGAGQIILHLEVQVSRVREPVGTEERTIERGGTITVEVPEIRTTSTTLAVTLEDGGEALVDLGNDPAGGRLFLRIKATVMKQR